VRRFLVALLSVLCITSFCGCRERNANGREVLASFSCGQFVIVEKYRDGTGLDIYILVHNETKVMYMLIEEVDGCGITVIVDENGKPLLWEGETNEN
jgi:hypothetical protein